MKSLVDYILESEDSKTTLKESEENDEMVWVIYDERGTIVNFAEDEEGAKKIAADYDKANPDDKKCTIKKEKKHSK